MVLITLGVFLALLVDEWRERAEHRELAEASLRRFRTEFKANRDAVASVKDKHVAALEKIRVYFAADPVTRSRMAYPFMATDPAFMEYTAWDLALATQALAYIEPDLAQGVAHIYAAQRQLDSATHDITLVMYGRGGDADPVPLTRSLSTLFRRLHAARAAAAEAVRRDAREARRPARTAWQLASAVRRLKTGARSSTSNDSTLK